MSSIAAALANDASAISHGLTTEELFSISTQAIAAKDTAYCPYSLFRVGCSLLTHQGIIITGANVENASYPVGTCAERVAMGSAVVQGHKLGSFKAIAVATDTEASCSPCGMCRQFLREFCELSTPIFMYNKDGKHEVMTLGDLLPKSFGPEALPPREQLADMNHLKKA